jgi:ATP-dependent DNA helicase PIF1
MNLSLEQQEAFDAYMEGKNIFITGPGGTGKSALIKRIVRHARSRGSNVGVCAMTGKAAVLLECGARTFHSWAGIGLGKGEFGTIFSRLSYRGKHNWENVNLLIVDEVSMMSLHMFNLLLFLTRTIRAKNVPFGGIQVLFSGDFYQLPPVPDRDEEDTGRYCFDHPDWNTLFPCQIDFKTNFRQSDPVFTAMLNRIRKGAWTAGDIDCLEALATKELPEGEYLPTYLTPTRKEADAINQEELDALTTPLYEYTRWEQLDKLPKGMKREQVQKGFTQFKESLPVDATLVLRVGAHVICCVNLDPDAEICNGSQGTVIGFEPAYPVTENHVADLFPMVEFLNGAVRQIPTYDWIYTIDEKAVGTVRQVPLLLGWAMTIHKSQGSTLECVELNGGRGIFANGQLYVALSRVKSMEKLYLSAFSKSSLKTDPIVVEFYKNLK